MNVRIAEIHARNLGPIDKLDLKLGGVNLVWGRNEKGKTHLVEFIIRSLFRNAKAWPSRKSDAAGKVIVEGLDASPLAFSPGTKQKIEDFWQTESSGLPADFSRLLVVRAAELDIGGETRETVAPFLSDKTIFNRIGIRISKSLRSASLSAGVITGPDQGEIKKHRELKERLNRLDGLFNRIDAEYSTAGRKELENELERVQQAAQKQEQAKRFVAGQTAAVLAELKRKMGGLDHVLLEHTREAVALFQRKQDELDRKAAALRLSEEKSANYDWLCEAEQEYRNRLDRIERPKSAWIFPAVFCAALAIAFLFLGFKIPAAAGIVLAVVFFILHQKVLDSGHSNPAVLEEKGKLESEFLAKFGKPLSGLPLMAEMLKTMQEDYHKARTLRSQIDEDAREQAGLEAEINRNIQTLCGEKAGRKDWNDRLRRIQIESNALDQEIRERQGRLDRLNIDPAFYVTESPGVEYSQSEADKLSRQAKTIQDELMEQDRKLDSLKHDVYGATGDSIAITWDKAIQNLGERRRAVSDEYRQLTAEIVGKIAVFSVLGDLAKDEDAQIEKGLASPEIAEPLSRITRRYERVRLGDGKLIVSDPYHDFSLDELSTGARDQVLLALRVGFASRWLKKESLFFILDDAFQHADWERRERLVDLVMDLARSGWQILYLTMDDHIRDLFAERGKTFGAGFLSVEL